MLNKPPLDAQKHPHRKKYCTQNAFKNPFETFMGKEKKNMQLGCWEEWGFNKNESHKHVIVNFFYIIFYVTLYSLCFFFGVK